TGAYRSLRRARALVFAVDSASTIHWLYPAYTNADEDPESIVLEPTKTERPFETSVILEAPTSGTLRIVSLVTEQALHVSDIERRPPALLSREALERDFHAKVTETRVELLP
ncbi:MAG TPA: hypothetical protein VM580_31270, partial [Labilithrix sp.]|nr:hypothetical protein [Labilithrix sp.]